LYNIGRNEPWSGFVTKPTLFLAELRKVASAQPEKLTAVIDSDVMDGGCSDAELIERYRKVVGASGGARVVVSADVHQYPPLPHAKEKFTSAAMQARRKDVLGAFGIAYHAIDGYEEPQGYHQYAFINSGFVMGPAKLLSMVMECVLAEGWDRHCLDPSVPATLEEPPYRPVRGKGSEQCFDDQRALTICAGKHPEVFTIDYTGGLMLTTSGMKDTLLAAGPDGLRNVVLRGAQCFLHLNCQDCPGYAHWAAWRQRLPPFVRAGR